MRALKRKLDELIPTLPPGAPSPPARDEDVPSPGPDEDIDLPAPAQQETDDDSKWTASIFGPFSLGLNNIVYERRICFKIN